MEALYNGLVIQTEHPHPSRFTQGDLFKMTSKSSPKLSTRKVRKILRVFQDVLIEYIKEIGPSKIVFPDLSTIEISYRYQPKEELKQFKFDDEIFIKIVNLVTGEDLSVIRLILDSYFQNLMTTIYSGKRANLLSLLYIKKTRNGSITVCSGSKLNKLKASDPELKVTVRNNY